MVTPDGFGLPPEPYLLALVVGAAAVGLALWRLDPPLGPRTVVAFTPWMALGGALHVYEVLELAPDAIAPFLGTPAVYVATGILAGTAWILALVAPVEIPEWPLGAVGALGLLAAMAWLVVVGLRHEQLAPRWPLVGLVVAVVVTALLWAVVSLAGSSMADAAGVGGLALVFAHVLDGISTAIGVDVLEGGERSPIPRAILRIGEFLPTADAIGVGWLFVLVKVLVAVGILWLFVPFVRETERQGHAVLVVLTAVGLGPGAHNLLLFLLGG